MTLFDEVIGTWDPWQDELDEGDPDYQAKQDSDALIDERFVRHPERHPKDAEPSETERKILSWIQLYGGMQSTNSVREYAQLTGLYVPAKENASKKSSPKQTTKVMLRRLFDMGYLDRPLDQIHAWKPRRLTVVSKLSKKGAEYLQKWDLYDELAPQPVGSFRHQMLAALAYGYVYLRSLRYGTYFEPQHEFLKRIGKEAAFYIGKRPVRPDLLFVMGDFGVDEKTGERVMKYAVSHFEIDCATEQEKLTAKARKTKRKTYEGSFADYSDFISTKRYRDYYGLPERHWGARVYFLTTKRERQLRMLRQIERAQGKSENGCSWFLTRICVEAGEDGHAPKTLDLHTALWTRLKGWKGRGEDKEPVYERWRFLKVENSVA